MTARTRPEQARPDVTRGFGATDAARAVVRDEEAAFERSSFMPRSWRRFVLSVCVGTMLSAVSASASADDLQQFELGKNRFDGGEYAKAAERFAAMLDAALPPCTQSSGSGTTSCRLTDVELVERARAYYAASLVALDRNDEADLQIAEILRKNFQFSPDPAAFPQKVVDRFTVVRGRLRQELEAEQERRAQQEREQRLAAERLKQAEEKWLKTVLAAASEERVVTQNSRFVASLPFGVGQFQNGNARLGMAFAVSEALLGSLTIAASQIHMYYATIQTSGLEKSDINILLTNKIVALRINQISFGAFAAVALTGIIQAHVTYVPEIVSVRKRNLPPRPTASTVQFVPTVGLSRDMFGVGLVGTF